MAKLTLLGTVAILATVVATPVIAQAAIQEPGAYAFYHPNADLGLGAARPTTEAMASAPARNRSYFDIHRGLKEKRHR
jgi:hypothetical protein